VTLKVFLARECVFIFGMMCQIWDCKGKKTFLFNIEKSWFFSFGVIKSQKKRQISDIYNSILVPELPFH